MSWQSRPPEIEHIPHLIDPERARALGAKLLALPEFVSGSSKQRRYNYSHAFAHFSGKDHTEVVEALSQQVFPDDEGGRELIQAVCQAALMRMSGLRPESGLKPYSLSLDSNRYMPGEQFMTHIDSGLNNVVAVTLSGDSGVFMHTNQNAIRGQMPKPRQITARWPMHAGDAVAIRNHPWRSQRKYRNPKHAVQNGDEARVTLQMELNYLGD